MGWYKEGNGKGKGCGEMGIRVWWRDGYGFVDVMSGGCVGLACMLGARYVMGH